MKNSLKIILPIATGVGIIVSIRFLIRSIQQIDLNNGDFVSSTALFVSTLTSIVIMIYTLRQIYLKENQRPKLFFAQFPMILMLIYVTTALDVVLFHVFSFGIRNVSHIWEHITTVLFALFCTVCVIVMLRQNNRYKQLGEE